MESLWILIPLSLVIAGVIGWAFWWAVNDGQMDDLDSPAERILIDDDNPPGAYAPITPKATITPIVPTAAIKPSIEHLQPPANTSERSAQHPSENVLPVV
jgi:cbb3-type cytochrome oxidase maturation protein